MRLCPESTEVFLLLIVGQRQLAVSVGAAPSACLAPTRPIIPPPATDLPCNLLGRGWLLALWMKLRQLWNLANRLRCPADLESPVPSRFVGCWLRAPMAGRRLNPCPLGLARRRHRPNLNQNWPTTFVIALSWNSTTDSIGLRTRPSLTSVSECEPGPQL